ncbi:MAG: acyl-CoA dehydrogenase family protein [Myxococcales bacterium]|nr:flavin-dependent monooxygenase [Myxococcales bacterium]HIL80211.1 flavin-dependent monooxygenase [Myxococcales bacterium]
MTTKTIDIRSEARGYGDELRERAQAIENARQLPADLSDRFADSGFYRACVPEMLGGLERPPAETMEAVEILARGDGSSAWCVFIGATSGSVLARIRESAARKIFADPSCLISGVFAPRGTATVVEGGYQVDGVWQWGSGTQNADWILAGCQIIRDGETERLGNGTSRSTMMLVPAGKVEFLDTWHVSGLCGTGSTDYAIRNVFVPEEHAVGIGINGPIERPLYAFPHFGLLAMGIAAVSLGLARSAIDELIEIAGGKKPSGSARPLAARASTQSEVSRAEAGLRSARAFYYEAIDAAWSAAQSTGRIETQHRLDVRLATTSATQACADAVDRMYNLAGGTSVYRDSPLQRIFRDVHVATQHMMVSPATLELTGRILLGLETDTALL